MFRHFFAFLPFVAAGGFPVAYSQSLTCTPSSLPQIVHQEGITERTSSIGFNCSGGTPSQALNENLYFFSNVNITNRLASATSNVLTGITLTADNGSGPVAVSASPTLMGPGTLVFNGATFTLSAAGSVTLQLTGLRGAANQVTSGATMQITVGANGSAQFSFPTVQLLVGQPEPGLYVGYSGKLICAQSGSPAPHDVTSFASFLAGGSALTSTRLTEGYADSFGPKSDLQNLNADTGTRIVIQYSGFPAGAQLYVPSVVAGSDATQPTAGGDLGVTASGGKYTPGAVSSLLLAFVPNTDANGAGGTPAYTPGASGSGTVSFDGMSQVTLTNGSGIAVYEVVDANDSVQESAQFPTFLVLAPDYNNPPSIITSENATLGPVSTVETATATDPIPRFQQTTPSSDCSVLGDCNASYFPALSVPEASLSYTAQAGGVAPATQYVQVDNTGGGVLEWTASVTYTNGSGWLNISPTSGENNGTIRIDAEPGTLAPGTYQATLVIDAGPTGTRSLPVAFVITPATAIPAPAIQSAVNAATFASGPLAPGSLATLTGSLFSGQNLSVTFNGVAAQVLFSNATQINLVVPSSLAGKSTAQVVVTANGVASAPFTVNLAAFAPGIFNPGILNQDNTVNSAKQPAAPGSIIQIFATGLSGTGVITAKIGSQVVTQPYYAGPAPGIAGLQQVDLILPSDLSGSSVNVSVCGGATAAQAVCSPVASVAISQP